VGTAKLGEFGEETNRKFVEAEAKTPRAPFWSRAWFWVGLAVIATGPFLFADIPPLADFPGHVGRYHIMLNLGHSPYLQRFYDFKWTLIGNLGADLLMMAIGPILGAERGAWVIAALTPALMVLSIFAVSRAVHGRVQPTSFLALPFVYASAFEWGFLNYDLAVALALLALALWIAWRGRPRLRSVVFIPLAFGLWVCHAAGWGLLGLLVGGYELQAAISDRGWRPAAIGQAALRVLPLTPPALLSISMIFHSGGLTPYRFAASMPATITYKLFVVFGELHDRILGLDVVSMLLVLVLFAFARSQGASITPALAIPATVVALATVLMPPVAAGITLADYRLAPVAVIVFILSIRADSMRPAPLFVVSALVLTGLRLAVTAHGWHNDSRIYERHLSALSSVPMGARILVLVPSNGLPDLLNYGSRPMAHLADLAIVRRDALVNSEWVIAGAQLLQVRANADIAYHTDPSQLVAPAKVSQALATARSDHFDYAWVLGRYPAGPTPEHLTQVYADDETRLFRVIR
jgi:hypothetical protein